MVVLFTAVAIFDVGSMVTSSSCEASDASMSALMSIEQLRRSLCGFNESSLHRLNVDRVVLCV